MKELEESIENFFEVSKVSRKAKLDEYTRLINTSPKPEWIVQEKGFLSIPIERMEWLMRKLFGLFRFEILKEPYVIVNTLVVTARVHYLHPITGEWEYQDGVGGEAIQTKKNTSFNDLSNMIPTAIEMGAPNAYAMAKKSAMKNIGVIFGSNLNRKNAGKIDYDQQTNSERELHNHKKRLIATISGSKSIETLMILKDQVEEMKDTTLMQEFEKKQREFDLKTKFLIK